MMQLLLVLASDSQGHKGGDNRAGLYSHGDEGGDGP